MDFRAIFAVVHKNLVRLTVWAAELNFFKLREKSRKDKPFHPQKAPERVPKMVGLGGLEPPTSPLSGVHSNQLSYRPYGGE